MEFETSTLILIAISMGSVGLIAGLLSGIFGLGGGVILVPALYYLFSFLHYDESVAMHLSVATSLALSVPATYFSFKSHLNKKNVNISLLKSWAITITLGVFLGAYISTLIGGLMLLKAFAIYLLIVAFIMAKGKEQKPLFKEMPKEPWRGLSGIFIGIMSSLLGIGGGTITVPKMTLFGIPMKQAVGTASALSCLACIIGTFSHMITGLIGGTSLSYSIGYVNWLAFIIISPLSIIAARGGAKLAHKLHADHLRRYFSIFLVIIAGKILNDIYHVITL